MTRWWSGHAIGLDTETDGKDPEDARIITACATRIRPGIDPAVYDWIARPERDIPAEATAVHGITTEHAAKTGRPRATTIAEIVAVLRRADERTPVVIHNASYDLTVLDREMRRTGLGRLVDTGAGWGAPGGPVGIELDGTTVSAFHVIDTLVLDKQADRYRPGKGGRKLPVVAAAYGIELTEADAHAADADTRTALRIAIAIARRCSMRHPDLVALHEGRKRPHSIAQEFAALRNLSLADLHTAQAKWAPEQAAGLADWARKNPDETDIDPSTVRGDWPLRWMEE